MAVPDEASVGGCVERPAMRKSAWTKSESAVLLEQVKLYGPQNWKAISAALPGRNAKSCRLRWYQHLTPGVDATGAFTAAEDARILRYQRLFPNKWSTIAGYLPGRTDNAIKNRWNSVLRKQLQPQTQPQHQESTGGGGGGCPHRDGRTLTLFRLRPGDVKMEKPIKGRVLDHMPTAEGDGGAGGDQSGACLQLFPLAPGDIVRGSPSGAAPMDVDCGAGDPPAQTRLFPSAPKVACPSTTAAAEFRAMVQAVRAL